MSYNKIEECINKISEITTWETQLISYKHKTHPNEFTCYTFNFGDSNSLKNTIDYMCKNFTHVVNKFNNTILDYTGFNSKNTVDKISVTNEIIKKSWDSLIEHINISDDTTSLKNIKANAFIFIGTYCEDSISKNIYLLARKNPILNYKQRSFYKPFSSNLHNAISEVNEPLLQFPKSFDAIVYDGILYTINSNCESIFNMEHSYKIICKKHLEELSSLNLIEDYNMFSTFASSGHNPKKFITYDKSLVEKLTNPELKHNFSTTLQIPLNSSNQFILTDTEKAKRFLSVICGKTKQNLFETSFCEVPSSVPLTIA